MDENEDLAGQAGQAAVEDRGPVHLRDHEGRCFGIIFPHAMNIEIKRGPIRAMFDLRDLGKIEGNVLYPYQAVIDCKP